MDGTTGKQYPATRGGWHGNCFGKLNAVASNYVIILEKNCWSWSLASVFRHNVITATSSATCFRRLISWNRWNRMSRFPPLCTFVLRLFRGRKLSLLFFRFTFPVMSTAVWWRPDRVHQKFIKKIPSTEGGEVKLKPFSARLPFWLLFSPSKSCWTLINIHQLRWNSLQGELISLRVRVDKLRWTPRWTHLQGGIQLDASIQGSPAIKTSFRFTRKPRSRKHLTAPWTLIFSSKKYLNALDESET